MDLIDAIMDMDKKVVENSRIVAELQHENREIKHKIVQTILDRNAIELLLPDMGKIRRAFYRGKR